MAVTTDINMVRELTKQVQRKIIPDMYRKYAEMHAKRPLTDDEVIAEFIAMNQVDKRNPVEVMMQRLDEATKLIDIMDTVDANYRLGYFHTIRGWLTSKDYARALVHTYTTAKTGRIVTEDWCRMFMGANPKYLMTRTEYQVYDALPDMVTVYRGSVVRDGDEEEATKRVSWSLDKDVAGWFAERQITEFHEEYAALYEAVVPKRNILMYCNRLKEKEVIVNVCRPDFACKKIEEFFAEDYFETRNDSEE